MGLKVFEDGRWLIQITRQGTTKTKRGKGGERAGKAALKELSAELEGHVGKQEAARKLGIVLAPDGDVASSPTFEELYTDHYEPWALRELHPSTRLSRTATIWHLRRFFGATPIDQIDSSLVDAFKHQRMTEGVIFRDDKGAQNRKHRKLSKAGLAEQLKVLRAILGWALRKGHLKTLPFIEMPKDKRSDPGSAKPVRYFTMEERARLLRRAKPLLGDVLRVGLLTGMRPGELFHLRCRSIDLKRRTITVEEQLCPLCPEDKWVPKVGSWRQLEIAPDLLPVLRRVLKGKRPEDLLFDNQHGAPLSRLQGAGGSFMKTMRRAGLARQGLSFYSLRHTFAADLASVGVSLEKIGALLGQVDPRSTKIYAHLRPESLSGVVDKITLPNEWESHVVPFPGPALMRDADEDAVGA